MGRFSFGTIVGVALLFGAPTARASDIQSAVTVVKSLDGAVQFDLPVENLELPLLTKLTGIKLEWVATPGAVGDPTKVVAGVAIPSFSLGDHLEGGLVATLPGHGEPATLSETTFSDPDGLAVGAGLISQISSADDHVVSVELFTSGAGAEAMQAFFDGGGTIEARMELSLELPAQNGPGGGSVPEPMSLGVWAMTAAVGVAYWNRTKHIARRAHPDYSSIGA